MSASLAAAESVDSEHLAGIVRAPFDFGLVKRNALLAQSGLRLPTPMKTGTTIAGIIYKDGVVLGADTRATEGSIIADKSCLKIHRIAANIYCCGAGTSADTDNTTRLIESQLELHRLATNRQPRVVTALTRLKQRLFQYQGYVSAALVLGGVDPTGSHLYTVYPHGSTDSLPFATMGSGSLAAMGVFESRYKDDLTESEAISLVSDAIAAGIFNDLGSGGDVNLTVISKLHPVKHLRVYGGPRNPRLYTRKSGYEFKIGSTEWIKETESVFKTRLAITTSVDDSKHKPPAISENKAVDMDIVGQM